MSDGWRRHRDLFQIVCKTEMNKWFNDFVIVRIEFCDDLIHEVVDEWAMSVVGFRVGDTEQFRIPLLCISKEILLDSKPMVIWNLLHKMVQQGYEDLQRRTVQGWINEAVEGVTK